MFMKPKLLTLGALMAVTTPVVAHVHVDAPNGGEVLEVGSVYTVTWHIVIAHTPQNWDVWYSTKGPEGPWTPIQMDLPPGSGAVGSVHTQKYLVSDKGRQFDCDGYKAWCDRKGIDPRYAAAESIRATAVIERFFLSLKDEWLRRIFVPIDCDTMRREVSLYLAWHAEHRPHQGLDGRTPQEVYADVPAVERARPRAREIPRTELLVRFHEGRRQLPIVELQRAA